VPGGGAETDTPSSAQSPGNYAYDEQGRLTSMTPGSGSALAYAYDASGNLTTLPTNAAGTYDSASELTSSSLAGTTTSYTYNPDGERTTVQQGSSTIATDSWDGAGNLTAYNNAAANMNAANYDANGLRASDAVTPAGGTATTQHFVWNTVGDKLLMDSGNAYIYGTGAAPAEQVNLTTGAISYLITDALGSVRGVVTSPAAPAATTSYDAWGNPQTVGGLASYTPFGYAGGYTDPTGLIYLVHRYYDPTTGQFISIDPNVSQTGEPYAYAGGDPVGEADPLGLSPWAVGVACGDCLFTEGEFQNLLAPLFEVAAKIVGKFVGGVRIYTAPNDKMMPPETNSQRIPDIYWRQRNWGWINELKVGRQTFSSRNTREALQDAYMLDYNMAFGDGSNNMNQILPIDYDIWWFAPNPAGRYGASLGFMKMLWSFGINIIEIAYVPGAPPFPRNQSKQQKEKEVKEIESGSEGKVEGGLEGMFTPFPGCHAITP
jgi:RHS repeat-associated protein